MLFFAGCGYDHQAIDDGFVYEPFPFWKDFGGVARREDGEDGEDGGDGEDGDLSPTPKISPGISPFGTCKKSCNFKDLRKISPISPISPGCRGCGWSRLHTYIHKETLNFTLLIYKYMRKPNPRRPKMRGDFGDIGDIFRKPSNHAGLRVPGLGDILGMSPGDGDGRRG